MRTFLKSLALLSAVILGTSAQAQQCTAFDSNVSCDTDTGRWTVTLSNTARSLFAPDEMQISTPDGALTPHQDPSAPLRVGIEGAIAGDTITLSLNAVQDGAGGAPGLDLCCMGDIEVTIPEGQSCEAPPPDRSLDVTKVCAPLGYEDNFGSNVECTFTVNYSGPPPTPQNPITVTDTLASGGPMTINSHWPPSGNNAWDCTPEPSSGPYVCAMHNGIDTTATAGYWDTYTTSFTVQAAMPEPYRNCAQAGIQTASGASVRDESCAQAGAFDLIVEKVLAEEHGGLCRPGENCRFEIKVTNLGPDPYAGDITLSDEVSLTGASNSGALTGITPPVCTIAELTSTGCTTAVSLASGQSTDFTVEYTVPATLEEGVGGGENCVALTDATMGPLDDPAEIDGHLSCAPFSVQEPEIRVEKSFDPELLECSAGSACDFTITIHNDGTAPFSGPVAIRDSDTPGGMVITSVSPDVCLPTPSATPFDCSANVSVPAGGSQVISFSAFMPLMAQLPAPGDGLLRNCVSGMAHSAPVTDWPANLFESQTEQCAVVMYCAYACHSGPDVTENLTITKSLLNADACLPGETCTYKIEVANLSNAPVTGAIMLEEHLPSLSSSVTAVRALPWSCGPAAGNVVPCVHPPATLAPGDVTSFEIDVAIPADFDQAQIANCAGFPGDSSPLSAARSARRAPVAGPASLFSRPDGYGVNELNAYLQIRGMPAAQAMGKATRMATLRESGAVKKGAREMSCAVKSLRDEPTVEVIKTCDVNEDSPSTLVEIRCDVSIIVDGAREGDQIDLTDTLAGIGSVASIEASPWFDSDLLDNNPCISDDVNAQTTCVIAVDADMAGGAPLAFSGVIFVDPWEQGAQLENCAEASLRSDPAIRASACAPITLPEVETPKSVQTDTPVPPAPTRGAQLVLGKTAIEACRVNRAAQRYDCAFEITATNTGTAPSAAPLVLTDSFKAEPKVRNFDKTAGAGWTCLRATPDAASCTYGSEIAPGGAASMQVAVTLPGLRDGGSFTNCVGVEVPQDGFLRTQIAQQIMKDAGFDVGRVDGAAGPRTRRAVIALQQSLGTEQTGVIDDALFAALGLDGGGVEQACATVQLPPMPELVCPAGQRKNSRGVCFTPEKKCPSGQLKNSAGKCYTPDRGCKDGQVKNSKGVCYTPRASGPSCDARTTVARGGECACRYRGMRKTSASRCVCRSGLPPVRGVGCVNVTINRGGGGAAAGDGVDTPRRRNCVTVAGITQCF